MTAKSTRKARALIGGLFALAILVALLMPAAAMAKRAKATSIYWGAQIGEQITGEKAPWDMRPVSRIEQVAGKGLSLIEFSSSFRECDGGACVTTRFPTTPLNNTRSYGAIPILNWSSSTSPFRLDDPTYRLSRIINGSHDPYIRYFAEEARDWGHPFFLRFDWEMNGFWFPWSESINGNRKGQFVKAWRHVHDIFTSVGATNVSWVWCPNVNIYGDLPPLGRFYPGSRYVDWTCLDGFNFGIRRGSPGWLSFTKIFHRTYHQIIRRIAPHKPLMIGETASSNKGGSKAAWIKEMFWKLRKNFRRVRAVVWLDANDRDTRWPIERASRKVRNAFRRGVSSRAYRPNEFGDVGASPIAPPPRR